MWRSHLRHPNCLFIYNGQPQKPSNLAKCQNAVFATKLYVFAEPRQKFKGLRWMDKLLTPLPLSTDPNIAKKKRKTLTRMQRKDPEWLWLKSCPGKHVLQWVICSFLSSHRKSIYQLQQLLQTLLVIFQKSNTNCISWVW